MDKHKVLKTHVARDLSKLHSVIFYHVDITTLLKDITLLSAEIIDFVSFWKPLALEKPPIVFDMDILW